LKRNSSTNWVSLWCVIITSACKDAKLDSDSIKSGLNIPCVKNTVDEPKPNLRIACSDTRINVSSIWFDCNI